jgi:hypothetical protein
LACFVANFQSYTNRGYPFTFWQLCPSYAGTCINL